MFGFLKNKLKEWVSGSKEKLTPEEVKVEEKPVEIKEKTKLSKKEKVGKKADKLVEKAKKKKTKSVPQKFDNAQENYLPDVEAIQQELATEEDVQRTIKEIKETQGIAEELEKEEISPKEAINEIEAIEEKHEQKKSFLSKIFGKKAKPEIPEESENISEPKESFLEKVRQSFIYKITEEDFNSLFEDLEMLLLENNVAMEVTDSIKSILSQKLIGKEIKKDDLEKEIKKQLKETLEEIIIEPDNPIDIIKMKEKPFVILFFGINGTGKTTSIAKLAHLIKSNNMTVALAAADTFRAASIEQISEHAKKLNIPLIKHDYGSDPAAVGFDAIKYAKTHGIDVVLIDTAGRMHTKTNLMSEMEKIVRVTNPDLKIFVAESIAGNDATEQAKTFHESIKINGSILSKADIDEKGGTIISISAITKKPIFYLGIGQNYEDLKLFNKEEFIKSLGLD